MPEIVHIKILRFLQGDIDEVLTLNFTLREAPH